MNRLVLETLCRLCDKLRSSRTNSSHLTSLATLLHFAATLTTEPGLYSIETQYPRVQSIQFLIPERARNHGLITSSHAGFGAAVMESAYELAGDLGTWNREAVGGVVLVVLCLSKDCANVDNFGITRDSKAVCPGATH